MNDERTGANPHVITNQRDPSGLQYAKYKQRKTVKINLYAAGYPGASGGEGGISPAYWLFGRA